MHQVVLPQKEFIKTQQNVTIKKVTVSYQKTNSPVNLKPSYPVSELYEDKIVQKQVYKQYRVPKKNTLTKLLHWKKQLVRHKEVFLDYPDRRLSKKKLVWIKRKLRGNEEIYDFKICFDTDELEEQLMHHGDHHHKLIVKDTEIGALKKQNQLLIIHFEVTPPGAAMFCKECGVEFEELTEFVTFEVVRIVYENPKYPKLKITIDDYFESGKEDETCVLALITEAQQINWVRLFNLLTILGKHFGDTRVTKIQKQSLGISGSRIANEMRRIRANRNGTNC